MCPQKNILLINNRPSVNKEVLNIVKTCKGCTLHISNSERKTFRFLDQKYYDLIIINSELGKEQSLSLCSRVRDRYKKKSEILVLTKDFLFEDLKPYLERGSNYISTIPVHRDHLLFIIHKSCRLISNHIPYVIQDRNITIYQNKDYVKYKNTVIFVTERERYIFEYVLTEKENCTIKDIKNYLLSKGIEINDNTVRTSLSKLRKKLQKQAGLDIIKNKYGKGYYISI